MCDPVAQDYHGSTRFDDPAVDDESRLLRHCRTPVQVVPVKENGVIVGSKISDQAFRTRKGDLGVSVDLECRLICDGKTWRDRWQLMPNTYAILGVTASDARRHSAGVAFTPKPPEPNLDGFAAAENPYHGEIILPMSGSQMRALYSSAEVIHSELDQVEHRS